ncbi:hypothetical protein MgSA37_02843 [Mucilaginibacter gotjawali]|uniref:Endonuclease/exonuclease/phosphatase domain-containing protein n=2 Tax=Mucilaginibacter gotjawali TaxID=1550579 RepID=A0A0X8X2Z0_9SPHI|nr:hypothetical protein MgSA37_02843 [Mucilaginibacter gotjawali]
MANLNYNNNLNILSSKTTLMKLVTWNMQGSNHSTENKWNTGVMNFFSNGADVCCLQECGAVPQSALIVYQNYCGIANLQYWTWGAERALKYILFYPADPNGNRCNLAIVSRTEPVSGTIVYPGAAPIWRPALGFQYNATHFIFSLHAISPGGPDVVGLLNAINAVAGNPGQTWEAAGDFNREPATVATAFTICPPDADTYSVNNPNKRIDYAVKINGAVVVGFVQGPIMSDHYSVAYTF